MSETLGFLLRDMTAFEPKPPRGLIEVWVAGLPADAPPRIEAETLAAQPAPVRSTRPATRAAIDDVLKELAPAPEKASGHVKPRVVYEAEVIETSKPARSGGFLGRLFKAN
ncbi:MAG: hypothetical protein OXC60_17915 [Litoreibacter sp.]|nr:hypothetical protein [Litoreibacter sp.]MCY4336536.1 hypothetical protein [Litoreibacter sp.]